MQRAVACIARLSVEVGLPLGTSLTRRQIIAGAALAAAAGAATTSNPFSALANVTLGPRPQKTGGDTLVVIFMRGGADGLNIVPPCFEDEYYRLRPSLGLPRPNDRSAPASARALDLDSRFGLHPALAPLLPIYHSGQLAVIHAIGSGDQTRSHFEAMATMERGNARDSGASSGWLARHLLSTSEEIEPPLRAVAITETMPESLRGATSATALLSLADYRLTGYELDHHDGNPISRPSAPRTEAVNETLRALYDGYKPDLLRSAGRETLAALDAVKRLDPIHYSPAPGVVYPKAELGTGMRQAACMIKGEVGLEVACLDLGGWDTHITQGRETGFQASRLEELGGALAAFSADLGSLMSRVTVVAMTEFGRRAYENTSLGTDHGRASCMFVMGGGVNGGKVYTDWPGLSEDKLEDHGDLRVTTDYRDVLAEVLAHRLKNHKLSEVFLEYSARFRGVLRVV